MDNSRSFGILMPISSLPSEEGIGTLGSYAYKFIDYISETGAKIWQVLPLNPTNYGDSPYQSCSSDALNYYFIDLKLLAKDGLISEDKIIVSENLRKVNYGRLFIEKIALLKEAFSSFGQNAEFDEFVKCGEYSDFALFMAIKEKFGHRAWTEWDTPYRNYNGQAVAQFAENNKRDILFWQFTQFIFLKQWDALKSYANAHGVSIMGDIPLYVAYDSVEVWKYGEKLFKVDGNGNLTAAAGCPPDGFTADGQLWGNPIYNWREMKKDGYKWWRKRIDRCLTLYDFLRIDHFRGFDRYWEVPPCDKTARRGVWKDGPKEDLFNEIRHYKIVAEDLGVIDDGVRRLMKNVGYPGMKVLEFAFDGDKNNEHKPSNCTENFVCYTGTHDNMPLRQYIDDLGKKERKVFEKDVISQSEIFGLKPDVSSSEKACRSVISLAFASRAKIVIIPLWDLLALGIEARMNLPATVSDSNWSWRFVNEDFTSEISDYLKDISKKTKRV